MKETVLSAKTSGTARKRFEVIVEVIKKNPPLCFFLRRAFFTFLELVRFRGAGHIYRSHKLFPQKWLKSSSNSWAAVSK